MKSESFSPYLHSHLLHRTKNTSFKFYGYSGINKIVYCQDVVTKNKQTKNTKQKNTHTQETQKRVKQSKSINKTDVIQYTQSNLQFKRRYKHGKKSVIREIYQHLHHLSLLLVPSSLHQIAQDHCWQTLENIRKERENQNNVLLILLIKSKRPYNYRHNLLVILKKLLEKVSKNL